jgi:hypothetical protein
MDETITPTQGSRNTGYRAERYGPNESVPILAGTSGTPATSMVTPIAPMALSGDFILTHSSGIYGLVIRFGETLRYWGKDKVFVHWSHAAIFVNDAGDIIEALGGWVQKRNISVYHGTEYVVVHLPTTTTTLDRQQAVNFAEFSLSDPYGWLTIVSMGALPLHRSEVCLVNRGCIVVYRCPRGVPNLLGAEKCASEITPLGVNNYNLLTTTVAAIKQC